MKILILLPFSFYRPSGSPLSSYYRVKAILDLGYLVDIATYPHGENLDLPNLKIYRFPKKRIFKSLQAGEFFKKIIYDLCLYINYIRLIINNKYNIIIIHGTFVFPAITIKPFIKVPILATIHGNIEEELSKWDISDSQKLYSLFSKIEKWFLKHYSLIITVTDSLKNKLIKKGLPASKIFSIANSTYSVQVKSVVSDKRVFEILYAGTFVKVQNLNLLFETARILNSDEYLFTLIGGNEFEIEEYLKILRRMKVEKFINLYQRKSPENLAEFINRANIVVSPRTYGENEIPMKIYDYMNYGKCILASDVPIHRNILNSEIAFLEKADPASFAKSIIYLRNNPEIVAKLGVKAKKYFETNFSFDKMKERYKYLLTDIINRF